MTFFLFPPPPPLPRSTRHIPWTNGMFGNNLMVTVMRVRMMAAMAVMMTTNPQAFCNEFVYPA